jgi:thiamine-phosphate pyrophosphorylase
MDPHLADNHPQNPVIQHCITELAPPDDPTVDSVQLRAKSLDAADLLLRARQLRQAFRGQLIINDRIDVCLASGADGVHLPLHRIAPLVLKARFGSHLRFGVSCHSLDEVLRAEQEGADYVYLSPIFESPSKPGYGPLLGLRVLEVAARAVTIPVLALGGINRVNAASCVAVGAAGIAGISLFHSSSD